MVSEYMILSPVFTTGSKKYKNAVFCYAKKCLSYSCLMLKRFSEENVEAGLKKPKFCSITPELFYLFCV